MLRTVKYIIGAVVAVAAFTAVLAIMMSVKERVPNGTYCGSYAGGLVVGNMTIRAVSSTFDMFLIGLGLQLACKNELFAYDMKTHEATVIGAKDPNNCIGSILTENNLTLRVFFDPRADIVTLDLGLAKIECKRCPALSYVGSAL
ncbi:conserved hypothetical protein [Leishmania braziliensis MHOM/BR/75/M2904]|uniref:Uncharacterized protein n=1 Tax=Leishmania braziliensis TaxID=5660 RepID=A4H8X7_LEIBR|nr:conserved hypothetical protein [Leishmania braziliensis MHOM/BR/75/M2904]CAJ2470008.1 unnamed protein product [Leishmania braziliensis]CAM37845.1 conserved hypothetical protein [Leishmania braziliensis MHOM/BR/75/M2904]